MPARPASAVPPNMNWKPDYAHGAPLDSASGHGTHQENVISWPRDLEARSARSD